MPWFWNPDCSLFIPFILFYNYIITLETKYIYHAVPGIFNYHFLVPYPSHSPFYTCPQKTEDKSTVVAGKTGICFVQSTIEHWYLSFSSRFLSSGVHSILVHGCSLADWLSVSPCSSTGVDCFYLGAGSCVWYISGCCWESLWGFWCSRPAVFLSWIRQESQGGLKCPRNLSFQTHQRLHLWAGRLTSNPFMVVRQGLLSSSKYWLLKFSRSLFGYPCHS